MLPFLVSQPGRFPVNCLSIQPRLACHGTGRPRSCHLPTLLSQGQLVVLARPHKTGEQPCVAAVDAPSCAWALFRQPPEYPRYPEARASPLAWFPAWPTSSSLLQLVILCCSTRTRSAAPSHAHNAREHQTEISIDPTAAHRLGDMLALASLLSLPSVLLTGFVTRVHASPDGVIGDDKQHDRPTFATALTGGEGCDLSEINDIRDGFAEMTALFAAATPFDLTSQPAREFFGPSIAANYTDMIAKSLQRAANYGVLQGNDGAINADIHIRCDDPMHLCNKGNRRDGSHAAYNIGNEPHVVFCSDYFRMDPLQARINGKAEDQIQKDRLMEYYNRASLWARMVMHFSDIGTALVQRPMPAPPNSTTEWLIDSSEGPMNTSVLAGVLNEQGEGPIDRQTLKYAYGATRAKLLAVLSTQMPYDAANNAENYALYALAQYIIKDKQFYPAVPIMDFPNEASVLTNENLQDGERCKYAFFDMSDVIPRPSDMELKGAPLPSAGSSTSALSSVMVGVSGAVLVYAFMATSIG